ncbi:MAG: BlaI/MecI/CopY family transcriptional regulator [Acidobacteriota bacterium]|nr:BlaI/MecI/CopY family transcriptional regulator [Acidobacteriota bacterium]
MKIPKFKLRGVSRPSEAITNSLGKLERETMNEVWRQKEVNVRAVELAFGERVAYTTIMTTLDRLFRKGLLSRRKVGRAFYYSARFTMEELERGLTEDVMNNLLSVGTSQIEPVLACLVDAVSDRDRDLLDELARLVQAKQLELENKE